MKQIFFLIAALAITCSGKLYAQQVFPTTATPDEDTIEVIQLDEATVVGHQKWKNDTLRYRYNQMKFYISIVLPYALEAKKLVAEVDSVTKNYTPSQRRKYLRSREKELKAIVSDRVRTLNITQGKYLVKLINRFTGTTCYKLISEYHNPMRAVYHQSWARLNGIDLNEKYDPALNKDFERACKKLGY